MVARLSQFLLTVLLISFGLFCAAGDHSILEQRTQFQEYVLERQFSRRDGREPWQSHFLPSQKKFAELVVDEYERTIGQIDLDDVLTKGKMDAIIQGTMDAVFYSTNAGLSLEQDNQLIATLNHLIARYEKMFGETNQYKDLQYEAYVQNRMFDAARAIWAQNEDIGPSEFPDTRDPFDIEVASIPTYWIIDKKSPVRLERARAKLDPERQIILVAQPNCVFTKRALSKLAKQADLFDTFLNHLIWIVQPTLSLNLSSSQAVIDQWPELDFGLMHRREEWSFLDEARSSPAFYFMQNGEIRSVVFGWPETRDIEDILKPMQEIGIDVQFD